MTQAFRFSEYLNQQAAEMQGRPKREKTRARILAATACQLEKIGYDALTVDDIIKQVGMARGTFYLYFENRSFAAEAVMMAYIDTLWLFRPKGSAEDRPFEKVLEFNRFYVATYAENATLLACLGPLCRERPELEKKRLENNHRWCQSVVKDLQRRCSGAEQAPMAQKTLLIWSMSAMVDDLLRELYIHQSPHLVELTQSTDQVAELISLVWYRSLYAEDVEAAKLDWTLPLAAIRLLR